MSRCYPFPPPGYVKSAPLELELSSKKEKRKHKDKKKKRKKHSATNGDLAIKEDDRKCKDIEQSGLETFVDETISNRNLATDSRIEQRFKPREELLSRSVLAAERLQAEDSRHQALSKGVNGTDSCERLQGAKSTTEGLTDSGLATVERRSRVDSSRVLSKGAPVASSCKRPEQAENSVYSNGVLSTKRKRLQADNSGDSLLSKSVLAADCKKPDSLQTGRSLGDLFMQATSRTILQADNSGNLLTSNNEWPSEFERPEKRFRADPTSLKVGTSGACSAIGQAEKGKISNRLPSDFERSEKKFCADLTRSKVGTNRACSATGQVENGKVPYHLLAKRGDSQEKVKPDVQLNGVMDTHSCKMQMNSSTVRQPINGALTATKYEESNKRNKPGKISLMNSMQASSTSSAPSNGLNEKVHSGYSMASTCEPSEQSLQGTGNVLTTDGARAKGKVSSEDAGATCEERSHIVSSRDDMRMLAVKTKADKSCNPLSALATGLEHTGSGLQANGFKNRVLSNGVVADKSCNPPSVLGTGLEHTGSGFQANGFKNRVLSNGVVAGHTEEQQHSGINLSSPALTAAIGNNSAVQIKAPPRPSNALLDFEEKSMKEKLMKLRIPHPGQVWVAMEDEDWLGSCKQQLQSKQGEKDEEAPIQQAFQADRLWTDSWLPDVALYQGLSSADNSFAMREFSWCCG